MKKLNGWLTTLFGVLLLLPLIGVDQLGTFSFPLEGPIAWIIGIAVLIIGIGSLAGGK